MNIIYVSDYDNWKLVSPFDPIGFCEKCGEDPCDCEDDDDDEYDDDLELL